MITTPSGLRYKTPSPAPASRPRAGQQVSVHYTGWLYQDGQAGKKFDSSRGSQRAVRVRAGRRARDQGLGRGRARHAVGGTRRLVIPPELGYGARSAGGVIPANATLLFVVELLGV